MPAKKAVQNDDTDDKKKVKRTKNLELRTEKEQENEKVKNTKDIKAKVVKAADVEKEVKPKKVKKDETKVVEEIEKTENTKDTVTEIKMPDQNPQNAGSQGSQQGGDDSLAKPLPTQQNQNIPGWLNPALSNQSKANLNTQAKINPANQPVQPIQAAPVQPTQPSVAWPTTTFGTQQANTPKPQNTNQIPSWLSGGLNTANTVASPVQPQPAVPANPVNPPIQSIPSTVQAPTSPAMPVNPQAQEATISPAQTLTNPQPVQNIPVAPANSSQNLPSWVNPSSQPTNPVANQPVQAQNVNPIAPQASSQVNPQPAQAAPIPQQNLNQAVPGKPLSSMPGGMPSQMPQMPGISPASIQPGQAAPQKPYKPMTLNDLAQQTPIFKIEDLDFSKKRRRELREQRKAEEQQKAPTTASTAVPKIESEAPKTQDFKVPEAIKPIEKKEETPLVENIPKAEPQATTEKKDTVLEAEVISSDTESKSTEMPRVEEHEPSFFKEITDKIKETLKESNINRGHIMGCIGGIFLLVIVISLIIIAVKWVFSSDFDFNFGSSDQPNEVINEEPIDEDPDDTSPDDSANGAIKFVDPSLYVGIIASNLETTDGGTKVNIKKEVDSSIKTGIESGLINFNTGGTLFVQSVEYLQDMRAVYYVDIRAKLNAASNPTVELNKYMSELERAIQKGQYFLEKASSMKASIKEKYDARTDAVSDYEVLFFDSVNKYDGRTAETALDNFGKVKAEQVDLKSDYKAWSLVEAYYTKYIPIFQTKLKDIQYNQEALVKGVQVYKLENSAGLDLIVEVDEGL